MSARIWSWLWVVLACGYFFVPVLATAEFSLKAKKGIYSLIAYERVFADPRFATSFGFSMQMALITIVLLVVLIVPTLLVVHLALPKVRNALELVSMMPFVIPSIVLVFGYIRAFGRAPFALTQTTIGTYALMIMGYMVLSLPYMYRAIDTGLRSMELRVLTEAARGLGASWWVVIRHVVLPSIRSAVLSGSFLTLAIVIGELTFAQFLIGGTVAFAPYLAELGRARAYEPAALTVVSLALTWSIIGILQRLGSRQGDLRPR